MYQYSLFANAQAEVSRPFQIEQIVGPLTGTSRFSQCVHGHDLVGFCISQPLAIQRD